LPMARYGEIGRNGSSADFTLLNRASPQWGIASSQGVTGLILGLVDPLNTSLVNELLAQAQAASAKLVQDAAPRAKAKVSADIGGLRVPALTGALEKEAAL